MQVRFAISPTEAAGMDTEALRENFLVQKLMQPGKLSLIYTHYDRMIVGGVVPTDTPIVLSNPEELRAEYFLERREMGIINVGGSGSITADGTTFGLHKLDALYLGKGTQSVSFSSDDAGHPAIFYLLSNPAHAVYPNGVCTKQQAVPVVLGAAETSNLRTVYKYIHLEGLRSCQLVMGLTVLEPGSVWNSIPPHTHTRRMEVYFYFDLPAEQRLFHFMGETTETRHMVMANHEAVISPPWSTHFGCGTSNYGFIWGMCGENLVYTDMDVAPVPTLL
jgi:4-deoxy-L-threo-5-hexosulose-uronate ketol-isomerase